MKGGLQAMQHIVSNAIIVRQNADEGHTMSTTEPRRFTKSITQCFAIELLEQTILNICPAIP